MDDRTQSLKQIRDEIWDFKKSPLYKERVKNGVYPVIGEGNHYAEIMFVGEAPGKNEAATGRPFCGASGKILDGLFAAVGLKREDFYVTNIVKDRPPMNRDPLPEEIALYASFLDRQIEIIQPKVIAALGRYSMGYLMKKFKLESQMQSISRIHGQIFPVESSYGKIIFMPLYHPAVALYDGRMKETLKKDFEVLKNLLSFST